MLDEATASVDNDTDAALQKAIRAQFSRCTVLAIAHRLHTIMDSTHILVMDKGKVAEFAAPGELLADPQSSFSKLVDSTGGAAEGLRMMATNSMAVDVEGKKVNLDTCNMEEEAVTVQDKDEPNF